MPGARLPGKRRVLRRRWGPHTSAGCFLVSRGSGSFDSMFPGTFRTARYAHAWLTGHDSCVTEGIRLDRDGTSVSAVVCRPRSVQRPLPVWVVLHGITRRGPAHPQLARFTRAVVSAGAVVIVPEVPEWMALDLAPEVTIPTVKASIAGLRGSGHALDAPVGLIGFSFSAPHAVTATAHPELEKEVAGSVSFGGYCDLECAVRFLMTGAHDWKGRGYRLTPDPYGRWLIGANYLTLIPEYAGATDVSDALRQLAAYAGDTGISSLDSRLEPRRAQLRASVGRQHLGLFDLFAPGNAKLPEPQRAEEMAAALVTAAVKGSPGMDPRTALAEVTRPVHLVHGRRDQLIPFSESLRLNDLLRESASTHLTVTRLFGHSAQDSFPSVIKALREVPAFAAALRRVLRMV